VWNETHLKRPYLRLSVPFFVAAITAVPAWAQQLLIAGKTLPLSLEAKQAIALDVRGQPDAFAVLELSLTGGLVSVISPGLPPWPLELGKGGRTQYALVTP
jgi:hypothetical protein